jgi:hypothetical protein
MATNESEPPGTVWVSLSFDRPPVNICGPSQGVR